MIPIHSRFLSEAVNHNPPVTPTILWVWALVSPIYDGFTVNPGDPNGGTEFQTEPNSRQTHNVVATMPGDEGYSPLWLRVVYDSAAWASVHSLDTALKAKVVPAEILMINCPIVSIKR
ncbi:MAG: hypothetical protein WDN46_22635 [Methylocella sp.]